MLHYGKWGTLSTLTARIIRLIYKLWAVEFLPWLMLGLPWPFTVCSINPQRPQVSANWRRGFPVGSHASGDSLNIPSMNYLALADILLCCAISSLVESRTYNLTILRLLEGYLASSRSI